MADDVSITLAEPECFRRRCKHFTGPDPAKGIVTCKAFPKGIPDDIAYGDNRHTEPQAGDSGIVYERDTG